MGINIWTVKQSDVALVKKIEEFIGFKRLRGKNSRDWMEGLNKYHQDPKSGPILINHIFIFSKSYLPAISKQKEYYDDKAGECNLCSTNMPNVEHVLYLEKFRGDINILCPLGLTVVKANECQNKL